MKYAILLADFIFIRYLGEREKEGEKEEERRREGKERGGEGEEREKGREGEGWEDVAKEWPRAYRKCQVGRSEVLLRGELNTH